LYGMAGWRIDNAKLTRGAVLCFKKYARPREDWDHDHCEGCWAKFTESDPIEMHTEGYVTEERTVGFPVWRTTASPNKTLLTQNFAVSDLTFRAIQQMVASAHPHFGG
jgi:phage terminase large subunit-like protein